MGYRDLIKTHVEEKEVTKKVEGKEVKGESIRRHFLVLPSGELRSVQQDDAVIYRFIVELQNPLSQFEDVL